MKLYISTIARRLLDLEHRVFTRTGEFIKGNIHSIVLSAIVFFVAQFALGLPYINVFLDRAIVYLFFIVFMKYLFQIPPRTMIGITLCIWIVGLLAALVKDEEAFENIGNLVYYLLWFDALIYAKTLHKTS